MDLQGTRRLQAAFCAFALVSFVLACATVAVWSNLASSDDSDSAPAASFTTAHPANFAKGSLPLEFLVVALFLIASRRHPGYFPVILRAAAASAPRTRLTIRGPP